MDGTIDGRKDSIRTGLAVGQGETSYIELDTLRACMTRLPVLCAIIPCPRFIYGFGFWIATSHTHSLREDTGNFSTESLKTEKRCSLA